MGTKKRNGGGENDLPRNEKEREREREKCFDSSQKLLYLIFCFFFATGQVGPDSKNKLNTFFGGGGALLATI